jgi:hypothetical protein
VSAIRVIPGTRIGADVVIEGSVIGPAASAPARLTGCPWWATAWWLRRELRARAPTKSLVKALVTGGAGFIGTTLVDACRPRDTRST